MDVRLMISRLVRYVFAAVAGGAAFGLLVIAVTADGMPVFVPDAQVASITGPADSSEPYVEETLPPIPEHRYIEVIGGCDAHYSGTCAEVRSGPGDTYPVVAQLRTGVVLAISDVILSDGRIWYHVTFDEWVRYPNRISPSWYISSDYTRLFTDVGILTQEINPTLAGNGKLILISRSEQTLYAYDGIELFLKTPISTGLDLTPTPRGIFKIYKKTPSRYMQGPLPGVSDQYYDLPGVPWDLYFTEEGGAIHGAFWHNGFGTQWSHGCVNVPLDEAEKLYYWADVGTAVWVRD